MSCTEHPSIYIVCALIYALVSVSTFWCIYQYVKGRDGMKSTKSLYCSVLVFFILIAMTCVSFAIMNALECSHPAISKKFFVIARVGFFVQLALLLWLLFYRLTHIFEGSAFAISQKNKVLFYVTYVLFLFVALFVVAMVSSSFKAKPIIIAAAFLFAFIYIATLISLLNYKLIRVAKQCSVNLKNDPSMMWTVTKVLILSSMSIIAILCVAVSAVTGAIQNVRNGNADGGSRRLLHGTLMALDLFANFYSFFLGFDVFDSYYTNVCGVCHKTCSKYCLENVSGTHIERDQSSGSISNVEITGPSPSTKSQNTYTIS
eukprot:39825_1